MESENGYSEEGEEIDPNAKVLGIDHAHPTPPEIIAAYKDKVAKLEKADLGGLSPNYPIRGNDDNFPKGGREYTLVPHGEHNEEFERLTAARDALMEIDVTGELKTTPETAEYMTEKQWNQIKDDGFAKTIIAHCVHNNYDIAQLMTLEDFKKFKTLYPTREGFDQFGDITSLTTQLRNIYKDKADEIPKAASKLAEFLPK